MRREDQKLELRTMGISNWCYDPKTKKRFSIQFYDYDLNGKGIIPLHFRKIMQIFPYDCLMYDTKHGIQFISFSLLKGLNYTKAKSLEISKELDHQDYWTEAKDLTLRVSAKWKVRKFRKRMVISKKPKFRGLIKYPKTYRISEKHLEFYYKYMDLPQEVYELYNECNKKKYKIKVYHYKTND